jgi:Circularly permutated YpsA SLOG family
LPTKLGKPVLHINDTRKERTSNPDSLCLEIQALSDFVCSNKIEMLNVAGPPESKEPGVYDWTLTMLRLFLIGRLLEQDPQKDPASKGGGGRVGDRQLNFLGQPLF